MWISEYTLTERWCVFGVNNLFYSVKQLSFEGLKIREKCRDGFTGGCRGCTHSSKPWQRRVQGREVVPISIFNWKGNIDLSPLPCAMQLGSWTLPAKAVFRRFSRTPLSWLRLSQRRPMLDEHPPPLPDLVGSIPGRMSPSG